MKTEESPRALRILQPKQPGRKRVDPRFPRKTRPWPIWPQLKESVQPAVLQREHRFPPSTFPREKEKGTCKASSLWSSKRGSRESVNSVGCVRVLFESREEIFEEEGERKNSLLIGTEVQKLREKEESEEYSKRERRRCKFSSFTMLARVKNYRNRSRKYILFTSQWND